MQRGVTDLFYDERHLTHRGKPMNSSTNATKRWWYIMPIVFITYSLAYLDRANFSFASAAGITEDLGITKGISSLLGALFFLGYFFFRSPARFTPNAAAYANSFYLPDPVGRLRLADRDGAQYSRAGGDSLYSRRRRGRGHAGDADLHQQLVY
jgi:hypothetical protein